MILATSSDLFRELKRKQREKQFKNTELSDSKPPRKAKKSESKEEYRDDLKNEVADKEPNSSVKDSKSYEEKTQKPELEVENVEDESESSVSQNLTTEQDIEVGSTIQESGDSKEKEVADKSIPEHPNAEVKSGEKEATNTLDEDVLFSFYDIFESDGSRVRFNREHEKSDARNLSKGMMFEVIEGLKGKYLGDVVQFGDNQYQITEGNVVFNSPTSLIRFLLLNSIDDDNLALMVARQLFLEKNPEGLTKEFNHQSVSADDRDIYALLLASKYKVERDIYEKLEELTHSVEYFQETMAVSNRKVVDQTEDTNNLINGINIATSALLLERLGLTEGGLPQTLEDVRGFATQNNIVKLSDQLGNDIAADAKARRRTIARDERMRGRGKGRRGQVRATRRSPIRPSGRDSLSRD